MSLATEIDTARGWLDDADRDLLMAAAALDTAKARRARILAALVALGDESETVVPEEALPLSPSAEAVLRERATTATWTRPAPLDSLLVRPVQGTGSSTTITAPKAPRPKKAGLGPGGRREGAGRKPKHDRAEIARVARQAHAEGRPMAAAVALVLGLSEQNAKKLIQAARKSGENIPHLLPPRAKKPATSSVVVSKSMVEIGAIPEPSALAPVKPVVDPKREPRTADELKPLFPPGTPRPPFTPAIGESVLVCDDCNRPFPRNVALLGVHTRSTHGRMMRQIEKQPRTWTLEDEAAS